MSTGDINEWTGGRRLAEPPTPSTRDKSPPPPLSPMERRRPEIRRYVGPGQQKNGRLYCDLDVFGMSSAYLGRLDEMLTLSLKEILQFFVTNAGIMEVVACETTGVFGHYFLSFYCPENHQTNEIVLR